METPFTIEQFFEVFEKYNTSVFPAQFIFIGLGILAIILIHTRRNYSNYFITGFLGFLWLWIGMVYHFGFFTSINKAAYGFGILFILQGLFFVGEMFRNNLEFSFQRKPKIFLGYFFILFGLIIYPLIGYLLGAKFSTTISLGLPCPTTILTFGFFMLTNSKFPRYLLIIPTIWALIGTFAAVNFGVYQDFVMLLTAIIANIYLLKGNNVPAVAW
ncbi:DUF6064 family protein [Salinimicrobium xinjiangense]|uniref:DUF6064 family protein n=1 Tax=Salinimicrobium xinjiangense TaxID=438596 RepID=UPI000419B648|nr:DUF6064 family protein [Salinimicrobium xinjiangense]